MEILPKISESSAVGVPQEIVTNSSLRTLTKIQASIPPKKAQGIFQRILSGAVPRSSMFYKLVLPGTFAATLPGVTQAVPPGFTEDSHKSFRKFFFRELFQKLI